jgi:hypothetical protein
MMQERELGLLIAADCGRSNTEKELFFSFELCEQKSQINHSSTYLSFW